MAMGSDDKRAHVAHLAHLAHLGLVVFALCCPEEIAIRDLVFRVSRTRVVPAFSSLKPKTQACSMT